jgi:hypothetical protein
MRQHRLRGPSCRGSGKHDHSGLVSTQVGMSDGKLENEQGGKTEDHEATRESARGGQFEIDTKAAQ